MYQACKNERKRPIERMCDHVAVDETRPTLRLALTYSAGRTCSPDCETPSFAMQSPNRCRHAQSVKHRHMQGTVGLLVNLPPSHAPSHRPHHRQAPRPLCSTRPVRAHTTRSDTTASNDSSHNVYCGSKVGLQGLHMFYVVHGLGSFKVSPKWLAPVKLQVCVLLAADLRPDLALQQRRVAHAAHLLEQPPEALRHAALVPAI